jgi:hypothetical protein
MESVNTPLLSISRQIYFGLPLVACATDDLEQEAEIGALCKYAKFQLIVLRTRSVDAY